jgi:regulatory protein
MTQQEHIAPVTYLFGAPAARAEVEPVETAGPRVQFVDTPEVSSGSIPEKKSSRTENVAMHALTRRGMSVAEMTTLLESREIEPDEVEAEIARLEGVGLLDDSALAENLVRTLHERKGLGRSAISAELRRRKVDQVAIEQALDSIDTDDELTRAIEVAVKRAGQLSSYDPATAKRRLGAYLQRRGYSGSVFSAAMEAALSPQRGGGVQFR